MIIIQESYDKNLIWYASFGSNLNRDRFLCYIKGGQPPGSEKMEEGCRDQSAPVKEREHVMNYPLYFAGESERWQNGGVAFIGLDQDKTCSTCSAKYLITEEQFQDVVKQENDGLNLTIDFDAIIEAGSKTLRDSWYGTVLYLGEEDGYPVFTFTSGSQLNMSINTPSEAYVKMIIQGLKTTLKLDNSTIMNYLLTKPGIDGQYSEKEIENLL